MRKTAILRTTVLVAGKNGYDIRAKGSTSAFPESGRSITLGFTHPTGRFRPEAEVQRRQFVNERAAQFAGETEPGLSNST